MAAGEEGDGDGVGEPEEEVEAHSEERGERLVQLPINELVAKVVVFVPPISLSVVSFSVSVLCLA